MEKKSKRKGSLTIEACISYSIFIMVIMTMLYIMRIVYAYNLIQHAVTQTAKELSAYTYLYQVSGLNDINTGIQDATSVRSEQFEKDVDSLVKLYEALSGGDYDQGSYSGTTNPVDVLKNMGAALVSQAGSEANNLAFETIARPMIEGYIGVDSRGNSANARLEALGIDGINSLDLSGSHFFEDGQTIDLVVCYTMDPIFPIDVMPDMNLVNRAYVRGITGKSVFD